MSVRELRLTPDAVIALRSRRPMIFGVSSPFDLAGVIYFARVHLRRAGRGLAGDRGARAHWPFWISVDQEGGRICPASGAIHDLAAGRLWAVVRGLAGRALCAMLAPSSLRRNHARLGAVLDVNSPKNPVIGDRALSGRSGWSEGLAPRSCERCSGARRRGVRQHFRVTAIRRRSRALPVVEHIGELDAIEFVPFGPPSRPTSRPS